MQGTSAQEKYNWKGPEGGFGGFLPERATESKTEPGGWKKVRAGVGRTDAFIYICVSYHLLRMLKRFCHVLPILLAALLVCSSCAKFSKPKREKITDPEQQEALRTRNADIPIDSLFTPGALKEVMSPFDRIAIGKYLSDYKAGFAESKEPALRKKYADQLHKKEKMKEEEAQAAAAKADSAALSTVRISVLDRMIITRQNLPTDTYSPPLTLYFMLVLGLFVVIFVVRVIRAFFVSPKND